MIFGQSEGEISLASQLQRVKKTLIAYAVATFIGTCIIHRRFDLKTYIGYLINFNVQLPCYYLFFCTTAMDCTYIGKLVHFQKV